MAARQHDPDALEAFGRRHVCYEVWSTANGAARWHLSRSILSAAASAQLAQAQLVHLRALDDFLSRTPTHQADVAAVHYLDTWTAPGSYLGEHRDWINSQLAHLSIKRQPTPLWNPLRLTNQVLAGFGDFLEDVHAERGSVAPFEAAESVIEGFCEWFDVLNAEHLDEAAVNLARSTEIDRSEFEFTWSYSETIGS